MNEELRQAWKDQNPSWNYLFFNNEECRSLIEENRSELLESYDSLPFSVQKSDYFRYIAVYELGGVYIDSDVVCLQALDSYITDKTRPHFGIRSDSAGQPTRLTQWMFYAPEKHPLMNELILEIKRRIDALTDQQLLDTRKRDYLTVELTGETPFSRVLAYKQDVEYLPKSYWGWCPGEAESPDMKAKHLFDNSWTANGRSQRG